MLACILAVSGPGRHFATVQRPDVAPARRYPSGMPRVAQPDLFAAPPGPPSPPEPDPILELPRPLARVRTAESLPWPDAAATMAEEHRALGLARIAGPEGERLAEAIMIE